MTMNYQSDRTTRRMRWTARIVGTAAAVFWLIKGIGHAVADPWPPQAEGLVLAVLMIAALAGFLVVWWR